MAKKTRKSTRKHRRRRTYRRMPRKGGSADRLPIIPPDSAFPHSTAGESSDNLLGYRAQHK
jgi:hypothetical protein